MSLEDAGALGDGDLDRREVTRILVGGESDDLVRVTPAQRADLVELQPVVGCRIDRDAVHDRVGNPAMVEEAHEIVDLLHGQSTGREDDGLVTVGYLLDQRPVGRRAAPDLHHLDAEVDDHVHRRLVEGRADRDEAVLPRLLDQAAELVLRQPRRLEAPDVLVAAGLAVGGMNHGLELPELEFDGGPDALGLCNPCQLLDDSPAVLDPPLMIVGHLEDEEITEIEAIVHGDSCEHRVAC